MSAIRIFAPAKVNLTLKVLGRRPDGFHELESLVAFSGPETADVITFTPAQPIGVSVSGPFAASISGANLVTTALHLIAQNAPELVLGHVHLEKNLPVAAGIGGGSADAAAVLSAVQAANGSDGHERVDWGKLAVTLGADVPVCLMRRLAWMTGLGERVAPVSLGGPQVAERLPALIVNPMIPVPGDKTARVFRALGAPAVAAQEHRTHPPRSVRTRAELIEWISLGENSLECAARTVVPEIATVLEELKGLPANLVRMSGGGPTCFALFNSEKLAVQAANSLRARMPRWWIAATTLG